MSQSEVARLRQEITLSYQACLRMFEAPSITAPHSFITARMERIAECQDQLVDIVGADAATHITIQAMREADEGGAETADQDTRKGVRGEIPQL